jgi:hypothetical protein
MAYRVYAASPPALEARIPFERPVPSEEEPIEGAEELLTSSPEARANTAMLKDLLRPLLEQGMRQKLPETLKLAAADGSLHDVPLTIDRGALGGAIEGWLLEAVGVFKKALAGALSKIGREPDPYEGLRVLLGGRLGMHPLFAELLAEALPPSVQIHRFKEPDRSNLAAPTVKTATAMGVLSLQLDRIGAMLRAERRDNFRYRVGRARHGQLYDVLDPVADYDVWREMGACTKPEVEVLFMVAEDDGEVAADDPRVSRAACALGAAAVGQRLYLRAVAPSRVELAAGPPGGEPERGGPCWTVHLETCAAEKVSG